MVYLHFILALDPIYIFVEVVTTVTTIHIGNKKKIKKIKKRIIVNKPYQKYVVNFNMLYTTFTLSYAICYATYNIRKFLTFLLFYIFILFFILSCNLSVNFVSYQTFTKEEKKKQLLKSF